MWMGWQRTCPATEDKSRAIRKKIVHTKKQITVGDLFATGLLNGVAVVYMAGVNMVYVVSLCTLL